MEGLDDFMKRRVVKECQVAISALGGKLRLYECQGIGQRDSLATGLRDRGPDDCETVQTHRGICLTTNKNHGNPQLG